MQFYLNLAIFAPMNPSVMMNMFTAINLAYDYGFLQA